jgi:iron complex transport system substrate-binding protein
MVASILGSDIKPRQETSRDSFGRVVFDMSGYPGRFNGPIKKALILAPVAWDFSTVDQTETNILATAKFIREEAENSFLKKIFPGFLNKKGTISSFGQGAVGGEEVLALQPDALIVWDYFSQFYRKFGFMGLASVSNYSKGKDKLYNYFGRLVDKKDRVDFLLKKSRRQLDDLPFMVPTDSQFIGFLVLHLDGTQIFPMTADFNRDIKLIMARNYGENFQRNIGLGLETVLSFNPEFIFLHWNSSTSVEEFYKKPVWKNLKAARLKQVYKMPVGASRMEGPVERPLLYNWILLITRPEIRPSISIRELIKTTYLEVYGYSMSDDELDEYLNLEENSVSANYEMLFAEKALLDY